MKLRAYLSGGMEFADGYGADWRAEMEEWLRRELEHESFNPVRESARFLDSKYPGVDFRKLKTDGFEEHRAIAREIVGIDCGEIIKSSDYVICCYDESAQRGAGTKGELTVAVVFGKPVYLIEAMPRDKIPSWVYGCADEVFRNFQSLKYSLLRKYSGRKPATL